MKLSKFTLQLSQNMKFSDLKTYFSTFISFLNRKSWYEKKNWYTLLIIILAVGWVLITYIQLQKVDTISKNLTVYNPQKIKTSNLSATELIETYFDLLRKQEYEKSCWLETLKQCRYENPGEFLKYQEDKKRYWFTKLVNGEKLIHIWQYAWAKDGDIEYVCVRTEYELSWENNPIQELWEYKILIRPTAEKEIAYKQCVWKWKNGSMIDGKSCPVLNSKCLDSEPKIP